MRTYRQVAECVRRRTGRTVRTCWIAEVKRELGMTNREAYKGIADWVEEFRRVRTATKRQSGTV